jgi:hypothetical protein
MPPPASVVAPDINSQTTWLSRLTVMEHGFSGQFFESHAADGGFGQTHPMWLQKPASERIRLAAAMSKTASAPANKPLFFDVF